MQLCEKHPSFRERSENVDLVVEISLQPWKVFKPDGVRCGFTLHLYIACYILCEVVCVLILTVVFCIVTGHFVLGHSNSALWDEHTV